MKNKDIIVVGLQPWDIEIGSNCKNIALELARDNRVLYVNRALDRISSLRRRDDPKIQRRIKSLRGEIPDLEQPLENLWVLDPRVILESVNKLPRLLFDFFNKRNNDRLARAIQDACRRLGFRDCILFIDNDFFRAYYLPEMLSPAFSVYYIRDFLTGQAYFKKHGARLEKGLMAKVDAVTANSGYLADYARQSNPNAFDIGQGCDFTMFRTDTDYPVPEDLAPVPGPRIGYVGALVGYRLDIPLLTELAKSKPEWSWVFVGPEDDAFAQSELHQLSNVHFLGRKDATALPAYMAHFDVCMNPQQVNEITLGNYPRKVDEYLAMGKPVVATFTSFMKSFEGYVYLCDDAESYKNAIRNALEENGDKQRGSDRRAFALTHTWENSVGKLYRVYDNLVKK